MNEIGRKELPHQPPWWIDPAREIFFVTICARQRASAPLLAVAPQILEAIRFYHDHQKWWVHLAVIMPDHVHLLVCFPHHEKLTPTVQNWKRWTARHHNIEWQRDFFDHRLRREESVQEKAEYILQNPVRADLVEDWQQWPHVWIAKDLITR